MTNEEVGEPVADETTSHRILVVEIDADIREILQIVLEFEGYAVSFAAEPAEAVGLLHEHTYHLVLTNVFGSPLSRMLDSIHALRDDAQPTPVGVLTAWMVTPEEVEQRGFAFLIREPFDLDDLISRVAAAIHAPLTPEQEAQAETARAYFAKLSSRDWDAFVALCTEDVVYALPGSSPFAGTIEGRAAFRAYTEQTFAQFPETRFEDIQVYATPNGLAARYKGTWNQPEGGHATMTGAVIFQFQERLIRRIGVHLDDARLKQLMGA